MDDRQFFQELFSAPPAELAAMLADWMPKLRALRAATDKSVKVPALIAQEHNASLRRLEAYVNELREEAQRGTK